jgi:hypothetical protein
VTGFQSGGAVGSTVVGKLNVTAMTELTGSAVRVVGGLMRRRTVDNELTQEELEKLIMKVAGHIDAQGEKVSLIPKWLMYRPTDLKALGLTHEDIVKLIKEKHDAT